MPKLSLLETCEVLRVESPIRCYHQQGDSRRYPSITTVLGSIDNPSIEAWRNAVGEEEAAAVSRRAANRGTRLHSDCENFILHGKEPVHGLFEQIERQNYQKMKRVLHGLDEVFAVEKPLISHDLCIGGTVDCIASVRGKPYIIDFKTASSYKSRDDIPNYFMQAAFYSAAWLEMTGMDIPRTLIAIACQESTEPLIYLSTRDEWIPELRRIRNEFKVNNRNGVVTNPGDLSV